MHVEAMNIVNQWLEEDSLNENLLLLKDYLNNFHKIQ